jgi:tetratricopeptide (TPR) repeat protein
MNLKDKKAALVFISISFLWIITLHLSGCSGKEGFILWGKSGGSDGNSDLSEFFSTIRSHPENPDSHYLLAGYYQQRSHHREAIAEFKKVISIDPKYVKAYNGLGVSYDLLGEFSNAIASYEAGLALDPKEAYLHNNLGYSYLMQGNPDQSISAFQKAISLGLGEPRFHNNLASAYAEKGQYDLALDQFLRGGNEAQAYLNMTEIYLHVGLYTEAGNHYVAALRLDPSKTLARTGGKASDTLASIFRKSRKNSNTPVVTVIPEIPVIRLAGAYSNAAGNGDGTGEWNYEMKMAILQGKPVPIDPGAPGTGQMTVASKKKEIRPNIRIEVSNGNGVERMAQTVGAYLQKNGYPVDRLTNSKPFNSRHTQIYYLEGNEEIAHLVAEQLPTKKHLIELKMLDCPSIQVKILLGKDMIRHSAKFKKTEGS